MQEPEHEDEHDERLMYIVGGARCASGDGELGPEKRVKTPSTRYRDFVTHTVRKISSFENSSASSSFSSMPYPMTHFVSCERFSVRQ